MKRILIAAFLFAAALAVHSQPSANEIVFSAGPGNTFAGKQIYSIRADGSGLVNLTNDPTVPNFSPSWSPDGARIVYSRNFSIWVMNADGTNKMPLADGVSPTWSSDGSKIAFLVGDGFTYGAIYLMNADGSNRRFLVSCSPYSEIDWSPDGRQIAFSDYHGTDRENIYVINVDGTGQTAITNSVRDSSYPAWSPDGSKIAFARHNGFNSTIYTMNADGSGPVQITNSLANDTYPSWSPDGMRLAFSSGPYNSPSNIYVMNADGTNVVRLTSNTFYSYSPDWRQTALSPQYQLSGRVTTPDGRGLRNASVSITDSLGVRRTTTTTSFGVFSFDHLTAGDAYTIGAVSKRYRFASQTVQITGNLTNVNFVALE